MSNEVAHLRLAAQHITQDDFAKPEEVVKHMLAMQAQDYGGGLWSIGLRTKNCTQADVEKAITDHKIVRIWPMRGTLHFVHADDVHWMLELLAPRATAAAKTRRLALGLTDEVMDEAEAVIRKALTGGKYLRRNELMQILTDQIKGIEIGNNQAGHIFRNFGERGIVCFGPNDGKQPTFALLDDWVPKAGLFDRDKALRGLTCRYFTSHGPALLTDLSGWAGLTMVDVKRGVELAGNKLQTLEVGGKMYYFAADTPKDASETAFLLPGFDEYLLGYKDRSAVLEVEYSNKIVPGGNGMFLPTIVLNGQVVGTWKRTTRKSTVNITLLPFEHSSSLKQTVGLAAERYGQFVGSDVTVS